MREIVKVMLAEGIDVDTIHEALDVIEARYAVTENETVDNYLKGKLEKVKGELATQKAVKRNLNKTTDKEARKEYDRAAGEKREIADEMTDCGLRGDYEGIEALEPHYEKAEAKRKEAAGKFSKEGTEAYKKVLDAKKERDNLADVMSTLARKKENGPGKRTRKR